MRSRLGILLSIVLLGGCSAAPVATTTTTMRPVPDAVLHADALQATVDSWLADTPIPGVAVGMLLPDGSPWVGAGGLADRIAGIAMTPDLTFHIGSITKTFTAILALQLVADGVIALDDHPTTIDPRIDPAITWADLLSHRSGIPEYGRDVGVQVPVAAGGPTLADLVDAMLTRNLQFIPGTDFQYSNTNYALLGELLETVTGTPYPELVRTRILEPLELDDTFVAGSEPGEPTAWPDANPGAWSSDLAARAGAAGAIVSSVDDLVRLLRDLFGGRLLDDDLVARAVTEVTDAAGAGAGYGLGIEVRNIDGSPAWGHTGGMDGYRSAAFWFPDRRMGIVVMLDGLDLATDPAGLVALLAAEVGG